MAKRHRARRENPSKRGLVLDRINVKILNLFQEEARIKDMEILRALDGAITLHPLTRRIALLNYVIDKRITILNAHKLGFNFTLLVFIKLRALPAKGTKNYLETHVQNRPEVTEAWSMYGEYDYFLRVTLHDHEDSQEYLTCLSTEVPNIDRIATGYTLERLCLRGLPLKYLEERVIPYE